jgi:formylglycine-generating enzyme required for sulfatase activity
MQARRATDLEWLPVPAGEPLIGADLRPAAPAVDGQTLPVRRFAISRTPVTNAQYARFIAATGHRAPAHWAGSAPPPALSDHPVTYVDWDDARTYCAWVGGRLPTEVEWEYAARGTDGRRYPWGDLAPTALTANFAGQVGATTAVTRYAAAAGPFGLLDCAGNVWEWTATAFRDGPYRADDGREAADACGPRIVRGGSYQHDRDEIRCAARDSLYPDACDVYIGFRASTDDVAAARELEWLHIPDGSFSYGDHPRAAVARLPGPGGPAHRVAVAAFALTRTVVTNAQYGRFTAETGARPPAHWQGPQPPATLADHPVTYVDWHEARAFCAWAGGRLPTEAEWEYAARGHDGRRYPWGDGPPDDLRAWFARPTDAGGTIAVGRLAAGRGPFGHLDLAGNVWEWTATLVRPYPYRTADGREDTSVGGERVLRGGSWRSADGSYLDAAFRSMSYPARRRDHIGFRVARGLA